MKDRNTNDIRLCPARLTVRQTLSILALVAAISLAALLFGCGDLEPLVEKDTASLEDLVLDPEVPDISYGTSTAALPAGSMICPLESCSLSYSGCAFGSTDCSCAHYHLGSDLAAGAGTTVYAPCTGQVKEWKWHEGYGGTAIIQCSIDGATYSVLLGHLACGSGVCSSGSECTSGFVSTNSWVEQGQAIAKIATQGYCANGGYTPHLHWGIRKGAYYSAYDKCNYKGENVTCSWTFGGYAPGCQDGHPAEACTCALSNWIDPMGSACGDADTPCGDAPPAPAPSVCKDGNGYYCGEGVGLTAGTLYYCKNGLYTDSQVCQHGCKTMPPGQNDKCEDAPAPTCPAGNGYYCGESVGKTSGTLYNCQNGVYTKLEVCQYGCKTMPPGQPDKCEDAPAPSCPAGNGYYCGESVGKTPGTLYNCQNGVYTKLEVCQYGCKTMPPGQPDVCAPCTPQCSGKQCGSDGCGGSCGGCSGGKNCQAGVCQCTSHDHKACYGGDVYWYNSCDSKEDKVQDCQYGCANGQCTACTPQCGGKQCGSDGCGGSCGSCSGGKVCQTGTCAVPEPYCGDGLCNGTEDACSCSPDCGTCVAECVGAASKACGYCGTTTRECLNGVWTPWGPCTGQGPCYPGQTAPCGVGGTKACTNACQWGECLGGACEDNACGIKFAPYDSSVVLIDCSKFNLHDGTSLCEVAQQEGVCAIAWALGEWSFHHKEFPIWDSDGDGWLEYPLPYIKAGAAPYPDECPYCTKGLPFRWSLRRCYPADLVEVAHYLNAYWPNNPISGDYLWTGKMWDCSDTGSLAVSFDGQKYWASGKETSGCW